MHRTRAVLLGTALVLASCQSPGTAPSTSAPAGSQAATTTPAATPIKIGVILPLTGNLGGLGKQMLDGYEVARAYINSHGGIKGRPVEFVTADAPTPEDAVGVAGTLSTNKDISVILGTNSSNIAIPASEVANRNGRIYWETGAAAKELTTRNLKYVFRTSTSVALPAYTDTTPNFLADAVAPGLGKSVRDLRIGLIYEDGPFGTSTADGFRKTAAQRGFKIVSDQSYSGTATDLSSVISKLIADKVEILVAASNINDAILIGRQTKELGFKPALIFGNGSGWTSADTIKALGSDINGLVAGDAVALNINDSVINPDVTPKYSEFAQLYRQRANIAPGTPGTNGFVGAMVLFQNVLPNADVSSADSIAAAARKVDIPDKGTIMLAGVKFDETGQNIRARWFIFQFQNGVPVPVYPKELAAAKLALPMNTAPGR